MISYSKHHTELLKKQRKTTNDKYHLESSDLMRICKSIDKSIFNLDECVLWKKFLTKSNGDKSCYINFYLKGKKLALHRILYINYIDDLDNTQYLKYTCTNPGQCCNINHFYCVVNSDFNDDKKEKKVAPIKIACNIVTNLKTDSPCAARSKLALIFND